MTDLTTPTTEQIENATPIVIAPTIADSYADVREELTAIFNEIWTISVKCIYIAEAYRTVFILWLFLTYLKDHLRYAPLLVIDAPDRGCGKTTLQQFLIVMSGREPDYRYTDFTKAGLKQLDNSEILFLDEMDSISTASLRQITTFLNTSFESSGAKSINARSSESTYGFRCLSGINVLAKLEPSTQSRSIRIPLRRTPSNKKLEMRFEELPLDHLIAEAEVLKNTLEKYSTKLQYYFSCVDYPQKAVLIGREGDVWRNMFDLASLIDEKYVRHLMTCINNQDFYDQDFDFPDVQYYVNVRQYNAPIEPEFYDGTDDDSTDYSTKDLLAGVKAVLSIYAEKSNIGIQTKELFRLISILKIKDAPITQRSLGRYLTSLGFKNDKNVDKNSGYRFDQTYETLSTKYPKAIDDELCTVYMELLLPHL
ncbi:MULTISPECIES: hypothetical protein [Acinetobacter]|uniref:hypothetical protein n=1 Tax=Acinetobacter TaxID=469 RepID=UPI0002AE92A2|nr:MULTISPECIES: hypothetical protein [Acinetobacter]ELW77072.1 hypothetical protein ACINWC743_A0616 [Acinetobacter sp. WC-743]MBJ8428139.1 hypothetical protein [Acinetobacter bereziniae]